MQIVKPAEQVDMTRNKRLLNRYRFIEYETIRILAAWLPATARMEYKLALGCFLWEEAQHVQHLYQRLRDVQTPAFRPPGDPALETLMAEAIHALDERSLLAGLFRVIKPALLEAYRWHSRQTFANPDAPTLYALKHILLDEEEHVAWARRKFAGQPAGDWERYIAELLTYAGGVTGDEPRAEKPAGPDARSPFNTPMTAARDDRFTILERHWDDAEARRKTDAAARRLDEFENYSQEMLAAETVALIIHLSPDMPWGFVYDSARHCYDETRHCLLGIEWLRRHGLDYTTVPQNTRIYAWRSQYDPATQYCLLTRGNEAHAFPHRRRSLAQYEAAGDRLSAQYVSYDMADERQPVAYGTKWLPELMARNNIDMPVEQFIEETVALWRREYLSGHLPLRSESEAAS
ncbi:MAG: DUF455 family protein [Anaerolineaceae bacterium]|nr:DUF455 family protein [Anaerolineaceae bacterium]